MAKNKDQTRDAEAVEAVVEWWEKLKENKAAKAQLRAAKDLDEIFLTPAYHRLYYMLQSTTWFNKTTKSSTWFQKEKLALIAGVLAHVNHNTSTPMAESMAIPTKGVKARVSEHRFRRLLQYDTNESLFFPMIRIVRLLDKKASVSDLATSLYWWNHPNGWQKKQWIFSYYQKAPLGKG